MHIEDAASRIESFRHPDLRTRVASIESRVVGLGADTLPPLLQTLAIDQDLVSAAASVKKASAQIDVVIHVLAILYSLPRLLEPGETVSAVSLGASNSGGDFDLETDRRVAEFKFIAWKGGGDAVRKKTLFEDFVKLALYDGPKRRLIYLLNLKVAQAFLQGNSSIERVSDRNARLRRKFVERFGTRYTIVRDLYQDFRDKIELVDLTKMVPELVPLTPILDDA